MSNSYKKPPSQRGNRPDRAEDPASCLLCGAHANQLGLWLPTGRAAEFLGSQVVSYTLCGRCGVKPDFMTLVENALLLRHAEEREPPPTVEPDLAALAGCSIPGGVTTIDGETLPIILPREEPEDYRDFDRRVCAAGIKKFVRPRLKSDFDCESSQGPGVSLIIIEEVEPGIRKRGAVEYFPQSTLN